MELLLDELRAASFRRVSAGFFCRRCGMLSVCGSQGINSVVLHLRVGESPVRQEKRV
jgi:hypothetical protein